MGAGATGDYSLLRGDCDGQSRDVTITPGSYNGCGAYPRYRHSGTANFIFPNGHAKSMARGSLNYAKHINNYPADANYKPY